MVRKGEVLKGPNVTDHPYWGAKLLVPMALLGFVVLLPSSEPEDSRRPLESELGITGLSAPPMGLPDTEEAGRAQALLDLSRGELLIGLWGDVEYTAFARYQAVGLRAVALGCIKGDYGWDFWRGYNEVARKAMRDSNSGAVSAPALAPVLR